MSCTIAVCLKHVHDTSVRLRLDASGRALLAAESFAVPNPADLSALALALRLRVELPGARVLALTAAPVGGDEPLRRALAAGADDALRLWNPAWPAARWGGEADGSATHTRLVAEAVAEALRTRDVSLVLAGEASLDAAHGCFGAFLAHALGAAYAHRAVALEPETGAGDPRRAWRVLVKLERGYMQELAVDVPAVVTVSAARPPPAEASLPDWIASRAAAIPVEASALPYPAAPPTQLRAPVPRVKRYAVPGADLDAEARIRAMIALPPGGAGTVLGSDAAPAAQADAILKLLEERGFTPRR